MRRCDSGTGGGLGFRISRFSAEDASPPLCWLQRGWRGCAYGAKLQASAPSLDLDPANSHSSHLYLPFLSQSDKRTGQNMNPRYLLFVAVFLLLSSCSV